MRRSNRLKKCRPVLHHTEAVQIAGGSCTCSSSASNTGPPDLTSDLIRELPEIQGRFFLTMLQSRSGHADGWRYQSVRDAVWKQESK